MFEKIIVPLRAEEYGKKSKLKKKYNKLILTYKNLAL